MKNKVFHVMYDDDDKLMDAARELVGQGIHVNEVFSPFPFTELIRSSAAQNSFSNRIIYVCDRYVISNLRYVVLYDF